MSHNFAFPCCMDYMESERWFLWNCYVCCVL